MPMIPTWAERLVLLGLNQAPAPLIDQMSAGVFRAVGAAIELKIFDGLHEQPRTIKNLAAHIGASEKGLLILMRVLEAGKYVELIDDVYHNSVMSRRWLISKSPTSVAPLVLFWQALLFDLWGGLVPTIRQGKPMIAIEEWLQRQPGGWQMFNDAMVAVARLSAEEIAQKVKISNSARFLLDVGGNHGLASVAFCRRYPRLAATVFDSHEALDAARPLHVAQGLGWRLSQQAGDFTKDSLGRGYDVALLFNVIHYFADDAGRELLFRAAAALNPGGKVVIVDQLENGKCSPSVEAFLRVVALNYFVALGGEMHPLERIMDWLGAAGFGETQLYPLRRAPGHSLIVAERLC